MQIDELLKNLEVEDLPTDMGLLHDLFDQESINQIPKEKFFRGDNLDIMRYLIKYLDGIKICTPQIKMMKSLHVRYIKNRLVEVPEIPINRLSFETGLSEKTIKEYLREISG